jgi:hypothetical protein
MVICKDCKEEVKKYFLKSKNVCCKCYNKNHRPKKICSICGELKIVNKYNELNEPICRKCYKPPKMVCSICKNNKFPLSIKEPPICSKCYKPEKKICCECKKQEYLAQKKPPLCRKCYMETYERPLQVCCVCMENKPVEKNTEYGPICTKCYNKNYSRPIKMCDECGENGIITLIYNDNSVCYKCYMKYYYKQPKHICVKCGKKEIVASRTDDGPICKKCWSCGKEKEVATYCNNSPICRNCYAVIRYNTDEQFRIKLILRQRVREAISVYSKSGKITTSKKYGIDYEAIIQHLGPCPGEREDYHIDHIIPLSAFDFDDLKQIRIAFAPVNHQWLKAKDNLKKGAKYDTKILEEYLNVYKNAEC